MDLYVDPNLCIGCELCVSFDPEVFEINAEGIAVVIGTPKAVDEGLILAAIEGCPTGAIHERD